MNDDLDSLVLRYLCKFDEKLDRLMADVQELKQRMGAVEEGQASLSRRLDRLDERVARIERRP